MTLMRLLKRVAWPALFYAAVLSVVFASQVQGQERRTKLRIAIPNTSICCLHLFAAQQWKVFEDDGLDVEIVLMRPQVASAAMIAGEIPYFAGVGANSVAATLRGMASRAVWFASDQLIYSL